jgi:hypothetical protein
MLPNFGNMSPKELRAMARNLTAMAQTIEMVQDPQKAMKKKVNQQVAGMKRKMKYGLASSITGTKK